MVEDSVMSEIREAESSLTPQERLVYEFVLEFWPTFPLEIAEHFNAELHSRAHKKRASAKYAYYLRKLIAKNLLLSKKTGHAFIVWPTHAERYRVIHDLLLEAHDSPVHIALKGAGKHVK